MIYKLELAEKILLLLEESHDLLNGNEIHIDGYSSEVVSYHIKKLYEAGLIDAEDESTFGGLCWIAKDLTLAGHDAVQKIRNKELDKLEVNSMQKELDKKKVFVVHGRNGKARKEIFIFLRSIGLHPIGWTEAVKETGKASPYVGEILEAGFSIAQAAVILFTPDDEARLIEDFRYPEDEEFETNLTPQARQNVIYEAGMAMGMFPERTIIVEFGKLRPISDITGRHVIRMNNSVARRQELANRLQIADCDVNLIVP